MADEERIYVWQVEGRPDGVRRRRGDTVRMRPAAATYHLLSGALAPAPVSPPPDIPVTVRAPRRRSRRRVDPPVAPAATTVTDEAGEDAGDESEAGE